MAGRSKYTAYRALDDVTDQNEKVWEANGDYLFYVVNDSKDILGTDAAGNTVVTTPAPAIEITFNHDFAAPGKTIRLRPGEVVNEVPIKVSKLHYRSVGTAAGAIRALIFEE